MPLPCFFIGIQISELNLMLRDRRYSKPRTVVWITHRCLDDAQIEHGRPGKQPVRQGTLTDLPRQPLQRADRSDVACVGLVAGHDLRPRLRHHRYHSQLICCLQSRPAQSMFPCIVHASTRPKSTGPPELDETEDAVLEARRQRGLRRRCESRVIQPRK